MWPSAMTYGVRADRLASGRKRTGTFSRLSVQVVTPLSSVHR
jgi:hypothetical protein